MSKEIFPNTCRTITTGNSFFLVTLVKENEALLEADWYYCITHTGVLRRGGMTPALAPRMPVVVEDAGKSRP